MAEVLVDGRLGKSTFRPQESDLQRLLLRQAGRHDFPEQPQHLFVANRALVAGPYRPQHFRFALGPIVIDGRRQLAFRDADLLRKSRTLIDERLDALVNLVNALADLCKIRICGLLVVLGHRRSGYRLTQVSQSKHTVDRTQLRFDFIGNRFVDVDNRVCEVANRLVEKVFDV